jgi:hypothetical protein
MRDNIQISDLITIVENAIIQLRSTCNIVEIESLNNIYTLNLDSQIFQQYDNFDLNGLTYKVDTVLNNQIFVSKVFIDALGWQPILLPLEIGIAAKITPSFYRGTYDQLNRLIEIQNNFKQKYPLIYLTNYWISNFQFKQGTNYVNVTYPNLVFGVIIPNNRQLKGDNLDLWDADFEVTNEIANNLIENIYKNTDIITPYDIDFKFDNRFFMKGDVESTFDVIALGTVFELSLTFDRKRIICKK